MYLDVLDLRHFYYRTRLGRVAKHAIRERMRTLWPDVTAQTLVGFGFAAPLMRPYLQQARRTIALMPAGQGVMPWPAEFSNVSVLSHEYLWPLQSGAVDRIVCLHGLETSDHPAALLDECARVLGPGGKAIFIVPNRSGLWARRDATPFGFGRPYSLSQLETQIKRHAFTPERHTSALFLPPSEHRFWLRSADMIEKVGVRLSPIYSGGVILLEVSKQTYTPKRLGLAERVRRPLRILEGNPTPVGASGRRDVQP